LSPVGGSPAHENIDVTRRKRIGSVFFIGLE